MKNQPKKRVFSHLSYEERVRIELLKNRGISRILGRSPGCIHYELREKRVKGEYSCKKAQQVSYRKRYWSKYQSFKALDYENFIREKLKLRWSPERISGLLRRNNIIVSPKAIYKYVDSRCLEHCLWKPKRKKQRKASYLHDYRKFTENKPVFSTGYYETDFIVCSQNAKCLLVLVDRYSRLTLVLKLEDRTKQSIFHAFEILKKKVKIKEIITDNDLAFSCWRELEKQFSLKIFFTHIPTGPGKNPWWKKPTS